MSSNPRVRRRGHLVHFYGEDTPRLTRKVARFLRASLISGGGSIVIASESRREAIVDEIARLAKHGQACFDERLVLLDDVVTLATFMRHGSPDADLFEATIGKLVRSLAGPYGRVRAYGEMVGHLWAQRSFMAAIEVERLWNHLLESVDFELYCSYPIDVLSADFQIPAVRPVLATHSRLVPSLPRAFGTAMRRAMKDVLGDLPHGLQALNGVFQTLPTSLPAAESTILRLRSTLPRYADQILAKARAYQRL